MRNAVLACALIAASAIQASANGRPPGTSTINFRQGNEQHIAVGMTFGLLLSRDGGATWGWVCELAIKYGGMYDPDYAYTSTGALFATTFDGSLVNRDGCNFDMTPHGKKFMSAIALGPDGAVYTATVEPPAPAASNPGDNSIFKSIDDGVSFPSSSAPGMVGDWWSSIEVAPTNANRLYLSGYRLTPAGGRMFQLFRSNDGGATWTPISTAGMTTSRNSTIEFAAISQLNPDHVYARVTMRDEYALSDGIYRSTNGGDSWTLIRGEMDEISFVARANGDLVMGTRLSGAFRSRAPSNGDAWEPLVDAPNINCLVENAAGEVWACTQNYGSPEIPGDDAGIMKSTDLVTWTRVLRYQDIQAPLSCPVGTLQKEMCEPNWCALKRQLSITSTVIDCPEIYFDAPPSDGSVNPLVDSTPRGCCDTGASEPPYAGFGLGLIVLFALRRRSRSASPRV